MAHNIHFNEQTGKHSFFSVQQKPWHGLGTIVTDYPTSAEALQFAGLDYEVVKRKLFTLDNENSFGNTDTQEAKIEVPHYFATVRTDNETALGIVGRDYQVVQNRDAFSFFDAIAGENGVFYETAGALGKGERIFITAKLPSYIKVGKDDLIEQYLFLTTSHDGFGSIMAAFTPIRIVCNNTLNAAFKNCSNAIKIRHTASARERLEQAHKVMGIADQLSTKMETIFNHWAQVRITDEQVKDLIRIALKPRKEALAHISLNAEMLSSQFKNVCESVFSYSMTSPTQQTETTRGTLFGAYNAITGYYQNVKSYSTHEGKLKSLLFGGSAQNRTQAAFQLCELFASKGAAALN